MSSQSPEITLRGGSASKQFLRILRETAAAFPDAFSSLTLPSGTDAFKARYHDLVPQFEARRQGARERTAIAQRLAAESVGACAYSDGTRKVSLPEALAEDAEPFELQTLPPSETDAAISVPVHGETLRGARLRGWIDQLYTEHKMTTAAHDALCKAAEEPRLDLSGRKVVVLGAAAAMAPVGLLRRAGATVLWIDLKPPEPGAFGGPAPLSFVRGGADLLREPQRVRATVLAFAEGEPVDICLFAYAPGKGREWRVTAAMNAIVSSLPPELVRTVSLFNSPSIPVRITKRELARAKARTPLWHQLATRVGILGKGGGHLEGDVSIGRSVLATQGVSYQGAQYLGKAIAAEAWATQETPLHVSANTAPITLTPSFDKRFFRLAFHGARVFGIEAYAPETSRNLSGLLMVHDWLDSQAPGNPARAFESTRERAEAMQAVRVHGGTHGLPNPAEPMMRMSYFVGAAWPWGQRI